MLADGCAAASDHTLRFIYRSFPCCLRRRAPPARAPARAEGVGPTQRPFPPSALASLRAVVRCALAAAPCSAAAWARRCCGNPAPSGKDVRMCCRERCRARRARRPLRPLAASGPGGGAVRATRCAPGALRRAERHLTVAAWYPLGAALPAARGRQRARAARHGAELTRLHLPCFSQGRVRARRGDGEAASDPDSCSPLEQSRRLQASLSQRRKRLEKEMLMQENALEAAARCAGLSRFGFCCRAQLSLTLWRAAGTRRRP